MSGSRVVLGALLLALVGCTFTTEIKGNKQFVQREPSVNWKIGETTTLDVARALGAPEFIERWQDELWFVYRYTEDTEDRLTFRLVVVIYEEKKEKQSDTRLIVAFDANDKLLYHALVDLAPDDD